MCESDKGMEGERVHIERVVGTEGVVSLFLLGESSQLLLLETTRGVGPRVCVCVFF